MSRLGISYILDGQGIWTTVEMELNKPPVAQ